MVGARKGRKKAGNVRVNVILRRVYTTIVAVENQ
jgi:hypothetical protein